jgi:hypothetical protein
MLGQLKNYLILGLIVALISLSGYSFIQSERAKAFKQQAEDREAMNIKERDWITKEGRLIHENSVAKIQSDKVAKEVFQKDSLIKDMGIKWNKVLSLSKTTVHNHYHIDTTIIDNGDSTFNIPQWKNKYLTVSGLIDLKKNRVSLDYDHRDTLTQVIHYKRSKKFLKLIPYGKFTFLSETTCADSSSKVIDQITYVRDRK